MHCMDSISSLSTIAALHRLHVPSSILSVSRMATGESVRNIMEGSQALTADFPAEAALHCHPAQGCSRWLWAISWPSADRTLTVAVIPSRPWQRQHTNAIKLPKHLNAGGDGGSWQCQTTVDLKLMKTGTTEGTKGMVTAMVWCCVVLSPRARRLRRSCWGEQGYVSAPLLLSRQG